MSAQDRSPVFIGRTRSFWLGILPALLLMVEGLSSLVTDPEMALPLARLVSALSGMAVPEAEQILLRFSPLLALVVASQRAGAVRPYTLRPGGSPRK